MPQHPAMTPNDPAYAGQKEYTPRFLKIYDPLVLGFFARVMWRCPTGRLVEHYQRHIARRHLDVGPGTGYFLDRIRLPPDADITLLDPNSNVLTHASRRLGHLATTTIQADVCKPVPELLAAERRFDSAALNYVLHCLPGQEAKAAAIANVAAVLAPEGVLFGATVLGTPELHTWISRRALRVNNGRGIFDNLNDTDDGLRNLLARSFDAVDVEVVGSVAVFSATRARGGQDATASRSTAASGSHSQSGRLPAS